MKKLITILAITSLFSFQAFAQLASQSCNDDTDVTCQAFQLGSEAHVLEDFSVAVSVAPSLGKVRRGELIQVNGDTHDHRGKQTGLITVSGEDFASFAIECDPISSDINYQGGVSSTLSACNLVGGIQSGDSLSGQFIDDSLGYNSYIIEFQASVPAGAQDGDVTGSIHIEIAYE